MVVVEEVVLANGAHVGDEALAGLHPELPRATLFHLVAAWTTWASIGCWSWSFEMWNWIGVRDPSRSSMSLTPDVGVDDERNLDPDQTELPAQAGLDLVLDEVDRLLRLARGQDRVVVLRQDLLELGVVADAGTRKVGLLATG